MWNGSGITTRWLTHPRTPLKWSGLKSGWERAPNHRTQSNVSWTGPLQPRTPLLRMRKKAT
ncbi:hypothetical protein GBAR_LOCUS18987 [Geodia barretti]|uniref:Uncharacterized protein n=1 Tax=Geodia barretti TaxID=519541 RepID=A0AA35WUV4_GEOBA|nr:hypothetical protein GBAR_LOCUS18987 [Geodia barretti]